MRHDRVAAPGRTARQGIPDRTDDRCGRSAPRRRKGTVDPPGGAVVTHPGGCPGAYVHVHRGAGWAVALEETGGETERWDPPRPVVPLEPRPGLRRHWAGTLTGPGGTHRFEADYEVIEHTTATDDTGRPWDVVHLRITPAPLVSGDCRSEQVIDEWWSVPGAVLIRSRDTWSSRCEPDDDGFSQRWHRNTETVLVQWTPSG